MVHVSGEDGARAIGKAMKGDHIIVQISISGETATIIFAADKVQEVLEDPGLLGSLARMLTVSQA